MNEPAFYLAPEFWGAEVSLTGQEADHLTRVLRLAVGDRVSLLDGYGRTGQFCILDIAKKSVQLRLIEEQIFPRPSSRAIIALAISKVVRRGFFLEKAVELGAHAIWLWQADHSQNKLSLTLEAPLRSQMIAGLKQCRNPWLPELHLLPGGIDEITKLASTADHRILLWEIQKNIPLLATGMIGQAGLSVYIVGPEGGFSQKELAALAVADFMPASLGKRVLRCETAATLCLSLHWWVSQLNESTIENKSQ